jgi:hypothetical protein
VHLGMSKAGILRNYCNGGRRCKHTHSSCWSGKWVFGRNKQLSFWPSPQTTSRHLLHRLPAHRLHPWYDPSSAPPDMFGSSQDRARQLAGRHRKDRKTSGSSYLSSRSGSSSTQSTTQPQRQYPLLEQTLGYVVHSKPSEPQASRTETPVSDCAAPAHKTLLSRQHVRQVGSNTSPDTDTFPLPPNALPTQALLGQTKHLQHNSDLFNANATIHDISSPFTDLSAHSPHASTLHDSADQFAARLRVAMRQQRHQSEHLSTVLHGNPSVPNFTLDSPSQFSIGHASGPYLSPRRMVSQPSPMRASNGLTLASDAANKFGDSRLPGASGISASTLSQDPDRGFESPSPFITGHAYVRDARYPSTMAELTFGTGSSSSSSSSSSSNSSSSVEPYTSSTRSVHSTYASARLGPHQSRTQLLHLVRMDVQDPRSSSVARANHDS